MASAAAGLRVFQHLPVDTLWLARVVVVQKQLRVLGEKRLALLA